MADTMSKKSLLLFNKKFRFYNPELMMKRDNIIYNILQISYLAVRLVSVILNFQILNANFKSMIS